MHPDTAAFIAAKAVPINMKLAGGLARVHMEKVDEYVDGVMRSASRGFQEGLAYKGFRRCDPQEKWRASLKTRSKKRKVKNAPGLKSSGNKTYDMARTDFYLNEYIFDYKGQEIKCPIWLPYVGQASEIYISGTKWYISPVLADKVISIGTDQIFVRLLRDRPTFSRMAGWYKRNGQATRSDLVYSKIYHMSKDKDKQASNNAMTTMPHYLFCKYGFAGTLEKYVGVTPVVGYNLADSLENADDYEIFTSLGVPPKGIRGRKRVTDWMMPDVQVALKKSDVTSRVLPFIASFFYVADFFPKQIVPQLVNSPDGWIAPLGYMLFSENNNRGKIEEAVRKHLGSLDSYADTIVIDNMAAVGIEINDIYDFFAIISEKFSPWISNNQDKINSLYNKEMSILPFVLFDVVRGIFNNYFALKASAHKELSLKEVTDIMKKNLKPGMCYQLSKTHGEVQSISYAGDNMAFKATATLTPQTATSKMVKKSNDRGTANDPAFRMHSSISEVAAATAMSKGDPVGTNKLNHYLQLDATNTKIVRHAHLREMQDNISRYELTTRPIE